MQWLKDNNGTWQGASNAIKLSSYLENLKDTADLNIIKSDRNKPVIYIPTHNIHDVYEWFRIFAQSQVLDTFGFPATFNFDKFGFWMHGYFDKERSQSVRDFFPNLIEVKAASTKEQKYFDDKRSSIDFIDPLVPQPNLFIDDVEIFETEKILLMDQFFETLTLDIANPSINTSTSIAIVYYANAPIIYASGTTVRIKGTTWYTAKVTSSVDVTINLTQYLIINIDTVINDIITDIGSVENGTWTKTSSEIQNGIYSYNSGMLNRIDQMSDKYAIYNQIVYCYQGKTQENFEYYLRRIESIIDANYSLYPDDTMFPLRPFIYSKGEAYLIKAEFDYNIDLLEPLHPSAPYNTNGNELCNRVLFLDYDMARKIMLRGTKGLGNYISMQSNIGAGFFANGGGGSSFNNVTFEQYDNLGNDNIIKKWLDEDYYDAFNLTGIVPLLEFRSLPEYTVNRVYSKLVDTQIDIVTYTQNTDTTTIDITYTGVGYDYLSDDAIAIIPGDLISLKWKNKQTSGNEYDFLEHVFLIIGVSVSSTQFIVEIFPKLDQNIINELTSSNNFPNYHTIQVDYINVYGQFTLLSPIGYNAITELSLLEQSIKRTRLKDLYEFEFEVTNTPYTEVAIMSLNNIPGLATTTAENGNYSYNVALLNVGDIILIANQTNQTENGVYEWRGVGNALYPLTAYTTTKYHVLNGYFALFTYSIVYTINPGGPTLPNFVSFTNLGNIENIIKVVDVKQSHPWKWQNGAFVLTCDDTQNFDNQYGVIGDVYGQEYTAQNYLDNYMGIVNHSSPNDNFDIAQMQIFNVLYDNNPPLINNPTRIGFELNKIYFGLNYKEFFLDYIKRHTWITITPAVASATISVFVSEVSWNKEDELGTVELLYQFTGIQIPAIGENVQIETIKDFISIDNKLNDTDNKIAYRDGSAVWHGRPDSGSYAHALMNYCYVTGTTLSLYDNILRNISAIAFKELGEPRISLRKRDKKWIFPNDDLTKCEVATIININISSPPVSIDSYVLFSGDIVVIKNQTILTENGVYVYTLVPSSQFVRIGDFQESDSWFVKYGTTNANKTYQAVFFNPLYSNNSLVYGTTEITFIQLPYSTKKDERLELRLFEIAKLGVDNDTQPWQKINMKYDSIENVENLLNIQIGINGRRRIRFIDGLTENNIINNINGQGQYNWILDENVLVFDAVVGCTQTNGPGTGTLIWYTGTWQDGIWVDGIWMQGTWENGTWLSGTHNSYSIQDYWYYVVVNTSSQINNLSIWENGTWTLGTWTGGTWEDGNWLSGTWANGLWTTGTWTTGYFYCGTWLSGTWNNGTWYGGDFCTGEWINGTFGETVPLSSTYIACYPRFGVNATTASFSTRAIWRNGIWKDGEFMSGYNTLNSVQIPSLEHRAAIWFAGNWINGTWWGGTFVTGYWNNGVWKDGVWFGGYYCTLTDFASPINTKIAAINPDQYNTFLGVSNSAHNLHNHGQYYHYLLGITTGFPGTPAPNFAKDAFMNLQEYYNVPAVPYVPKAIDTTQINNATTLNLIFGVASSIGAITYQAQNTTTGAIKGDPFIAAVWANGTWENGTWLNGVWLNGIFKRGIWANGFWLNGTLGET